MSMAEAILSSVIEGITGQLGKAAVEKIALLWGVEDELHQLGETISTIKSVLVDAEKKQVQSEQIKTWLQRLEDGVDEADDLVDEFSTEDLRQQVMTGNIIAKQVRTFFSTKNQLAFRHKMGKKIRDLTKKLGKTAEDRRNFNLDVDLQDTRIVTPTVREEDVVGRDDEKMKIRNLLLEMKTEENIGIIPIVGVGGVGKTTLALQVYKDAEVNEHFEPIMWVDVPKEFDVEAVVKEIINPGFKDDRKINHLRDDLKKKIEEKKYLLVLDDVWGIENREKWLELENLLRDGANGSRIIVTTRHEKIAHIINGPKESALFLGTLDEENSWILFKKLAFKHGEEPKDGKLVEIGKAIMGKCRGIPLVIRTIASMLYSIKHEEWSSFKEKELSTIQNYKEDVLPILKLSYDHLPSHLKHCFGYCSLFPKNYVFDVEMLIKFWMAQGFIKLSDDRNQCLEGMGYQHFKDLLHRSFFEIDEIDDESSKVTKCKMHDFMHDLATSVTGTKGLLLSLNNDKTDERTRHIAFNFPLDSPQEVQALLVNTKRLRTILDHHLFYNLSYMVLEKSYQKCKFLRTLDLHYAGLKIIPASIGKLKHLRYLDLSNNKMKALPNSVTRLQNLQTLNLSYCEFLREIPSGITKMFNLRHLHIESESGTTLHGMPSGLDQLTNLQRLSFLLPRGCLCYQWIPQNNESLFLHHISNWKTLNMMDIRDLQHLSDGLKSFTCLQEMRILRCSKLESLSPGLNHLTSLLNLSIEGCPQLETLSPALHHLTSLQQLKISRCSKLESLSPGLHHLTSLLNLSIEECPELETLSPALHNLTSLQQLKISRCSKLESISPGLNHLTSLQRLEIGFCDKLEMSNGGSDATIQWQLFESLSVLILGGLSKIVALPQGLQQLANLQEIQIIKCENLEFVLEYVINLKKLSIVDCPNLKSLPGWIGSLETLEIRKCPIFLKRCRDDIEDYWPLISHIRHLILSPVEEEGRGEVVLEGECLLLSGESIPMNSKSFFYYLSKLKTLNFHHIEDLQHLPDGLKRLTSLENLTIRQCSKLQSLSPGLHHLTSLKKLDITDCEELEMPNDDAIMWQHLQSLSVLWLTGLPKLVALPQGLQQLTTLQEIKFYVCVNLEAVLENISNLKSLKKLVIEFCRKLKSLPEGIDCLTSLETLHIEDCPILLERCREDKGDYWPKISHIKDLILVKRFTFTAEEQHQTDPQEESSSSKTRGLFNCAKIFKH